MYAPEISSEHRFIINFLDRLFSKPIKQGWWAHILCPCDTRTVSFRIVPTCARIVLEYMLFYLRNQSNNSSLTSSQNHKFNRPAPAPRADRHRSNGSNSGSGSGSKVGREHKPLNRLASLLLRKSFKYFFTDSVWLPVRFRSTSGYMKSLKCIK